MTCVTVCSVCTVDLHAVQWVTVEYHMHECLSRFIYLYETIFDAAWGDGNSGYKKWKEYKRKAIATVQTRIFNKNKKSVKKFHYIYWIFNKSRNKIYIHF